jgi:GNAT superfamily N-acetyltransferase
VIADISLAPVAALDDVVAHLGRHHRESGRRGQLIFQPRSADEPFDAARVAARLDDAWRRPVGGPGWVRTLGLWIDGAVRGHIDVDGGGLLTDQHRATLGMGIEAAHRGQGWGRRLMTTAIDWSRGQGLAWLDLAVFAHNEPARALYRAVGFREIGAVADRFRVDGQIVDALTMTLKL